VPDGVLERIDLANGRGEVAGKVLQQQWFGERKIKTNGLKTFVHCILATNPTVKDECSASRV
jgi:hypothetical protein